MLRILILNLQLNVDSEWQIFEKLFHGRFIYSQGFLPEICWEEIAEEIFFFHISFWWLTYLLDYGDFISMNNNWKKPNSCNNTTDLEPAVVMPLVILNYELCKIQKTIAKLNPKIPLWINKFSRKKVERKYHFTTNTLPSDMKGYISNNNILIRQNSLNNISASHKRHLE